SFLSVLMDWRCILASFRLFLPGASPPKPFAEGREETLVALTSPQLSLSMPHRRLIRCSTCRNNGQNFPEGPASDGSHRTQREAARRHGPRQGTGPHQEQRTPPAADIGAQRLCVPGS